MNHILEINEDYIQTTLYRRSPDAHKGNFGKLLLFAGSVGMAGAAILSARSALKSGAGLVQFLLPDFASPLLPIFQISVPEATCVSYARGISLSGYQAISAGSGLGNDLASQRILSDIIDCFTGTLVLDADALNMAAANEDLADNIRASRAHIILTPHIGEARRLLHTSDPISGEEARAQAVTALAEQYHCIAILKGAGTLVTACSDSHRSHVYQNSQSLKSLFNTKDGMDGNTPGNPDDFGSSQSSPECMTYCEKEDFEGLSKHRCICSNDSTEPAESKSAPTIYRNTTGNPGMATAGSGDCLAGLIASLAAQGYAPLDAARIGVFIHGKAGDLAAAAMGEMGLTSCDIANNIPYALQQSCRSIPSK